jgi:purine-cytosine permease-like protein
MDGREYVKSVVKGLTIGHICLGFAAAVACVTVATVGWTQIEFLVSWVPVILTAVFLAVTTLLLRKDMTRQSKAQSPEEH